MKKTIHVNCAGGVVYSDNKVLTINMIPQNEIIFPKGHVDPGESHEQTALREVFEETGYKTKIKGFLGSLSYEFDENGNHYSKTVYYYLLELLDKTAKPTPQREIGEDFDNLWLPINEALKLLTHDGSKDLLRKAVDMIDEEPTNM
jgi:8-oxo-dGTP pyrophosphatase MutT (NUDIX family)